MITYRKLTITELEAADVAAYLGFNEDGNEWYVYRVPQFLFSKVEQLFAEYGMQVYHPTSADEAKPIHQPQVLDYVFVLTDAAQVRKLWDEEKICPVLYHHNEGDLALRIQAENEASTRLTAVKERIFQLSDAMVGLTSFDAGFAELSAAYRDALAEYHRLCSQDSVPAWHRWVTVPHSQMHSMMLAVQFYEQIEFVTPDSQTLGKGDLVRVVSGFFAGVEGVLLTNQGSNGGQVYVSIIGNFGYKTAHIPDNCIQVLGFSRNTNHFYYKVEAFERLMTKCLDRLSSGRSLTSVQQASLQHFLYRYALLTGLSRVNAAKLTACRYVAHSLLGNHSEAAQCLQQHEASTHRTKQDQRAARRSTSGQEYIDRWVARVRQSVPSAPDPVSLMAKS